MLTTSCGVLTLYSPPLDKIDETTQIATITLSGVQCIVNTVKADGQHGELYVDRHGSVLLVDCEPDCQGDSVNDCVEVQDSK